MLRTPDIWAEARRRVRALGGAAAAEAEQAAETLLATGRRREALVMRLIADACQTLLSEGGVHDRKAG